jgi:mono/diheme cytochrome c family protein
MPARIVFAFVILLLTGFGASAEGPVTSAPDAEHGEELAVRLCSNCHLVSSAQEEVVADVPSFHEIANMQDQTAGSIMAKIIIPKHPMPVIPITQAELNDLAAYILTLRDPVSE